MKKIAKSAKPDYLNAEDFDLLDDDGLDSRRGNHNEGRGGMSRATGHGNPHDDMAMADYLGSSINARTLDGTGSPDKKPPKSGQSKRFASPSHKMPPHGSG